MLGSCPLWDKDDFLENYSIVAFSLLLTSGTHSPKRYNALHQTENFSINFYSLSDLYYILLLCSLNLKFLPLWGIGSNPCLRLQFLEHLVPWAKAPHYRGDTIQNWRAWDCLPVFAFSLQVLADSTSLDAYLSVHLEPYNFQDFLKFITFRSSC